MLTLVKRSAFIGLGFAAMNYATIKRLGEKIAEESNLSEEEGRKLVNDLIEESKKSKSEFKKTINTTVRDTVSDLNLATSEDIRHIEERLENIEKNTRNKSSSESRFVEVPSKEEPATE